jgi:hypothetical protein
MQKQSISRCACRSSRNRLRGLRARRAGKEAFDFLEGLHHAMADHLEPVTLLVDGDRIALEAEGRITALMDLPNLPAGALKKDQTVRVRMFAFYDTAGPLITHVRVAGWPPVAA